MNECIIGDFRIRRPAYEGKNADSVKWLAAAHAKSESMIQAGDRTFSEDAFRRSMERHITRFGCGPESLAFRGHDMEDFLHTDWERMRIYKLGVNPRGEGMDARMEVYAEITDKVFETFYPEGSEPPQEMIHVTCTGYVAPSAMQKLVVRRGWAQQTGVVHAYHMGCYAAMPALRMASAFLSSPKALKLSNPNRVDIVHTEVCALQLDPSRHTPEQLVVQSLFADGHIRYSITSADQKSGDPRSGLRFTGVHEELIPGSLGSIGWILGDHGMRMLLTRDVPDIIAMNLRDYLKRMFTAMGVDAKEALNSAIFAVHPGGPRIIDKVATVLELAPWQVAASRRILHDCGNMSSATIPHIWSDIVGDTSIASGTLVISLAFGPGLTVYGAALRKV